MISSIQIEKMSREEKLQAMEALWTDLSQSEAEIESPAWHEGALEQTKAKVAAGEERIVDWEAAKLELRERQRRLGL